MFSENKINDVVFPISKYRIIANYKDFSVYYGYFLFLLDLLGISVISYLFSDYVSIYYGAFILIVLLFVFYDNNLYDLNGDSIGNSFQYYLLIFKSYFYCFVLFCVFAFLTQAVGAAPHRDIILLLFASVVGVNFTVRVMIRLVLSARNSSSPSKVVVIGDGNRGRHLASEIKFNARGMEFAGFVAATNKPTDQRGIALGPYLGRIEDIDRIVNETGAHHVVLAPDHFSPTDILGATETLRALPALTYVYNSEFTQLLRQYRTCSFGGCMVLPLARRSEHRGLSATRLLDILLALVTLILFFPLFLFTALAIKLDSPGPVFYVTERIGLHGKAIKFWKFRSMKVRTLEQEIEERRDGIDRVVSGNVSNGDITKVVMNDQITRVGRFIRMASIDELPQLFSVLMGTMSLVGPRPPVPYELPNYKDWHLQRFDAKPGITGLWQILARSRTTHDEMVVIDLYYIEHRSFLMDIEMLVKTVPVVLFAEGAA